jgi:hypothetical protein
MLLEGNATLVCLASLLLWSSGDRREIDEPDLIPQLDRYAVALSTREYGMSSIMRDYRTTGMALYLFGHQHGNKKKSRLKHELNKYMVPKCKYIFV